MKYCTNCKLLKTFESFAKDKSTKDGYAYNCKVCKSLKAKQYYYANHELCKNKRKKYYLNNKEKHQEYQRLHPEIRKKARIKWRKEKPWELHFYKAKDRCNNPKNNRYYCYGARGIKFYLTKEQTREIWIRDNACNQNKPSIDRIDNDGHYEFSNCRFIELAKNIKRKTKTEGL